MHHRLISLSKLAFFFLSLVHGLAADSLTGCFRSIPHPGLEVLRTFQLLGVLQVGILNKAWEFNSIRRNAMPTNEAQPAVAHLAIEYVYPSQSLSLEFHDVCISFTVLLLNSLEDNSYHCLPLSDTTHSLLHSASDLFRASADIESDIVHPTGTTLRAIRLQSR